MSTLQHKLRAEAPTRHGDFDLDVRRNEEYFVIALRNGTSLGQISKHASRAFGAVVNMDSVRLSAFVNQDVLIGLAREATSTSSRRFKIGINVYGAKAIAGEVGELLSSNKMFLQDPDRGLDGACYFNPHILCFPDIQLPTTAPVAVGGLEGGPEDVGDAEHMSLEVVVSQIYSSVTRYRDLERTTGGSHITSKLHE